MLPHPHAGQAPWSASVFLRACHSPQWLYPEENWYPTLEILTPEILTSSLAAFRPETEKN